jgi:hypothetical protein
MAEFMNLRSASLIILKKKKIQALKMNFRRRGLREFFNEEYSGVRQKKFSDRH